MAVVELIFKGFKISFILEEKYLDFDNYSFEQLQHLYKVLCLTSLSDNDLNELSKLPLSEFFKMLKINS